MFSDEPRSEMENRDHEEAALPDASPPEQMDPPEAYFDRERWRAVGEDTRRFPERESPGYLRAAGFSSFSIAVLGIVTLFAGLLGVVAVHYLPTVQFPHGPLPHRSDFNAIPSQWIGYEQVSAFPISVVDASCFTLHESGHLLIGSDRQLAIYSPHGKRVGAFPLAGNPQALAFGAENTLLPGKLLVAYRNRVESHSLDNTFFPTLTTVWSFPEDNADIRSITVTADAVYLGDAANRVVHKCDHNGTVVKRFGQPERRQDSNAAPSERAAPIDFSKPGDAEVFDGFALAHHPSLCVSVSAKSGTVYATNPGRHRVEAFTPEGTWEPKFSWGDESPNFTGFCACCNPVQIIVLDSGDILTVEKTINRIKIYDPKGKLLTVVAGSSILDRIPQSLLSDDRRDRRRSVIDNAPFRPVFAAVAEGRVVVLDPVFQLVRYFDRVASPVSEPPSPPESPPMNDEPR